MLCAAGPVSAAHLQVVLLGGQSNMDGHGYLSGLPITPVNLQEEQLDVLLYGTNIGAQSGSLVNLQPASSSSIKFGPEVTFGRTIADVQPDDNFALIKYAWGGTDLENDWDINDGSHYTTFKNTVTAGLAALTAAGHTYEISGMIWMQGERDVKAGYHNSYEANLTSFIADIRSNYGADLSFVVGQLSDNQDLSFPARLDVVRAAQADVAAADANTGLVVTDDFSLSSDVLHFDSSGQMDLGEAFAEEYLMLRIGIDNCNVNMVSGFIENSDTTYEACEILLLGPDFIAAEGANLSINSGWEITLMPGFSVEQGATLKANVCGQSLCMTSESPMPNGCHSCVDQICDIEPSCCGDAFNQSCLDMVDTVCELVCESP